MTSSEADLLAGSGFPHILAVIVVYKMQPSESITLRTLLASADQMAGNPGGARVRLRIVVADNTPGGQLVEPVPGVAAYHAFPQNPGLAPVYNLAIDGELASLKAGEKFDWLLTLDQDTHLPPGFLAAMAESAARYENDGEIAAIVPRVFDGARLVSPMRFVAGFPQLVGAGVAGVLGSHASAINSGSLLRIAALKRVGGYDHRFPLNNGDTALFDRLDRAGYRVALAGEVAVQHEFSMLQREDRMTLERYRKLLKDERDFWDLHMGAMARTERLLRLMGRLAKSYLKGEDKGFRRVTSEELRYRLTTQRSRRISCSRDL